MILCEQEDEEAGGMADSRSLLGNRRARFASFSDQASIIPAPQISPSVSSSHLPSSPLSRERERCTDGILRIFE